MKRFIQCLSLAFVITSLLSNSISVFANEPILSNESGIVDDGNILIVTGSDFGTKDIGLVNEYFDNFTSEAEYCSAATNIGGDAGLKTEFYSLDIDNCTSGGNFHQLEKLGWGVAIRQNANSYSTGYGYRRATAAVEPGVGVSNGDNYGLKATFTEQTEPVWISMMLRYNPSGRDSNVNFPTPATLTGLNDYQEKLIRLFDSDITSCIGYINAKTLVWSGGSNCGTHMIPLWQSDRNHTNDYPAYNSTAETSCSDYQFPSSIDKWMRIVIMLDPSSNGAIDGEIRYYLDTGTGLKLLHQATGIATGQGTESQSLDWAQILNNHSSTQQYFLTANQNENVSEDVDDIVISNKQPDAPATVYLSNNSTWGSGVTDRWNGDANFIRQKVGGTVQAEKGFGSWSDTGFKFEANLDALDNSNGIYLYVTNWDGETNETGYQLVNGLPPKRAAGLEKTAYTVNTVTLTWDANTESDLDHYNIYYKVGAAGNPDDLSTYDGTGITQGNSGSIAVPAGTNEVTLTGLSSNVYFFVVSAVDNEGTPLESKASNEVATDNVPPAISSIEVNNVGGATQLYTNATNRQVTVRIAANDVDGTVQQYLIQDDNGTIAGSFQDISSPGGSVDFSISFTLNDTDKNRTIYAWVKDNLGATGSSSKTNVWLDRTPPTSAIGSPINGAHLNALSTITGTATDGTTGCGVNKIEIQVTDGTNYLKADDSWTTTATWFSPDGGTLVSWSHNVSAVTFTTDTQYIVKSRATDNATNVQSTPIEVSFTYDTTRPTGIISYSASDTSHVDVGILTITAQFSESLSGTPKIRVTGGGLVDIDPAVDMTGSGNVWTKSINVPVNDRTAYTVTVSDIFDRAGNSGNDIGGNFSTDTIDTDSDGTRDFVDEDDDNDGMPDTFESEYNLDPLDASDASPSSNYDEDGLSNLEEFQQNFNPAKGIEQPVLDQPMNGSTVESLTPLMTILTPSDYASIPNLETHWQISIDSTFEDPQSIVFDFLTDNDKYITSLPVLGSMLEIGTTYFWRVLLFDDEWGPSQWSEMFSFTTPESDPEDADGDGVPDDQAIEDATVDLDGNGSNDSFSDTYKAVNTVIGDAQIGVKASSENIISIDYLKSVDPDEIEDTDGMPDNLLIGLIEFKVTVASPGDTAQVTIYLSQEAPNGTVWYKYNIIDGWQDYSVIYPDYVTFSDERDSLTLTLEDGGAGDADGVANGVIVDPSGPGWTVTSISNAIGGGDSGCFIATAAYGSAFERHVEILREFRDVYLMQTGFGRAFVDLYYKYSPALAGYIAKHDSMRAVVRWGLAPVVGAAYVALNTTAAQKAELIVLLGLLGFIGLLGLHQREG